MIPPSLSIPALLAQAAATPQPDTATRARFLALMVTVLVVFLGALAILTIMRIIRRRAAARLDSIATARTKGPLPPSPWQTAGQRATPEPSEPASGRRRAGDGDDDLEDTDDGSDTDDGRGGNDGGGDDDLEDTDTGGQLA